ncbi:MAG: hypothetical protein Unbinned4409contig1002_23 [Prokaryotic dsDNA virus sp.]|nr:MAG: hypothetical protein Unbinned4409contig1002_23 [Prokaryotic dsDNA virus sp.]|tara:strand:- start:12496 stop:15384 length:2889 start_codon:yes stop_codon:yes gene_type:complete
MFNIKRSWALGDCKPKVTEQGLPEAEFTKSSNNKKAAAQMLQSSRTLGRLGVNKSIDLFRDIFESATRKDLTLHEMTDADLKKFKWELQDRESWVEQGFGTTGTALRVLEANLKRIPGGKDLYNDIRNISAYHREHTRVNNNRISVITDEIGKLAGNIEYTDNQGNTVKGIDIDKLAKLETKVVGARNQAEKEAAINEITNYLGALNSENSRTAAGDLYLSVRDAMENTPISELTRTDVNGNKVPWGAKEQESLKTIQDNWFEMRKDLVGVLKNALRTEKQIISQTDRNEGGRRRLTEYLDRIDQYINTLEFKESNQPSGRKYDVSGKEKFEWGLDGKKNYELNTELGYMPHYVLTITKDLQMFNDYAMDHTQTKSAFEVFSDQVRLWEGGQGILNRVKSRQDINQEYYSRNPFLFLSKYLHEVASYNHQVSLKKATQGVFNMMIDFKRNAKDLSKDQDMVNRFVEQAADVVNTLTESALGQNQATNGFSDKMSRALTGLMFIRTMGFNTRSAIRNKGQVLLEKIRMGYFRRNEASDYLTDTTIESDMKLEAKKHGILWTRDGNFLKKLQTAYYDSQGIEGTKGTLEERPLLPGLREVTDPKTGKKTIEMVDETMADRLLEAINKVAQKGSVLHTMVENTNRFGSFRVGFAAAHKNLSKQPQWWVEQEMGRINTTPEQRRQWINNQAGKLAYNVVSDVHFEYGKIFKSPIFQSGGGAVLGQFQHYRFSLFNMQHDIFKRGWRDIKSGDMSWNNEGAAQLYRLGTTYAVVSGLTSMFGLGFANLFSNDNFEWLRSKYNFYTAERDSEGKLTEEGRKQAEQATYGSGSFSDLGPTVGTLIEIGEMAHWWTVDMDSYIPMLKNDPQDMKDLESEDFSYKIMRLFNIQAARTYHHTVPAIFNKNLTKAFYTETGLYTDSATQKQSREFWEWARDVTGVETTGYRKPRKIRTPKVQRNRVRPGGITR